jgi:Raf kinase inhibitor-like YbhB/YbcL family protein
MAALALPACAHDGRTLRQPSPRSTSTGTINAPGAGFQANTASSDTEETSGREPFTLTSQAFDANGPIPKQFTCDGADVSPPLEWVGVPKGTVELAIIVYDPTAKGFIHWIIAGLKPKSEGVELGSVPVGAIQANNDFNNVGWNGPCPPSGQHTYVFGLYAMLEPLGLAEDLDAKLAQSLIENAAVYTTFLQATYSHGTK